MTARTLRGLVCGVAFLFCLLFPAAGAGEAPPEYDALPLRFRDMDEYGRLAMEPYRDDYDALPLEEKAALYAEQFERMNGRPPVFDPDVLTGTALEPPPPEYDSLPLRFRDMNHYDQLAMRPYRDTYDALPVTEKARLYGAQFALLNQREAYFDPAVIADLVRQEEEAKKNTASRRRRARSRVRGSLNAMEDWAWGDPEDFREPADSSAAREKPEEKPARKKPRYDTLPMFFADMDRYERIALEPYRSTYDYMSITEKAEVYSRAFEAMFDRMPLFDPEVLEMMKKAEAEELSAYEAKSFLYKPATPKPPLPTEEELQGEMLQGLTGPWAQNKPPEPAPEEVEEEPPPQRRRADNRRMESLREGWNASDVLRGARER